MVQFSDWVKTQVHRPDGVGRLAREAVVDAAWPADGDFETCLRHIKKTERTQYVNGLEDAWGDYCVVVRCTPPGVRCPLQEPEHVLESGTKVRTHETLDDTKGMTIVEKHLNARAPNKEGVIVGIVGGHGGDVYWVRHPDTVHVAAYGFWEFELADEKTK